MAVNSKGKILIIEGKRTERTSFSVDLTKKGYIVSSVPNGSQAIEMLPVVQPHAIIVDAESMKTSGKRICQQIHTTDPSIPIILIVGKNADPEEKVDANERLIMPFTAQKLLNRLKPFLPLSHNDVIRCGMIELDVRHRLVRSNGQLSRLTPRLVVLLRLLIEKQGAVIPREDLFRKAWETNYTGDTRTLDVHISWLRNALGDNPRSPRFLKTLRGVGYRLDVE